jgi:hypothetical protein
MNKWINEESLKHLMFELERHKKHASRQATARAAYRIEENELLARLKLHLKW